MKEQQIFLGTSVFPMAWILWNYPACVPKWSKSTFQGQLTIQTVSLTIWWQVFLGWSLTTLPRLRKQVLWRHGPRNVTWCLGWIFQNYFSEIIMSYHIFVEPFTWILQCHEEDLCILCGGSFYPFNPCLNLPEKKIGLFLSLLKVCSGHILPIGCKFT